MISKESILDFIAQIERNEAAGVPQSSPSIVLAELELLRRLLSQCKVKLLEISRELDGTLASPPPNTVDRMQPYSGVKMSSSLKEIIEKANQREKTEIKK